MNYRLAKEDKHSFTVQHPDGSHILIAKAGLHPKVFQKIKKLEPVKMSKGGFAPSMPDPEEVNARLSDPRAVQQAMSQSTDSIPVNLSQPSMPQDMDTSAPIDVPSSGGPASPQSATDLVSPFSVSVEKPASDQYIPLHLDGSGLTPEADQIVNPGKYAKQNADTKTPIGTPTEASALPAGMDPLKTLQQAQAQQAAGIQGRAQAESQASKEQAAFYQQALDKQKELDVRTEQTRQQIDSAGLQYQKDYADGKIDPNRVWSNASTGNKVMASLGLILGGMGSALTGQPNAALQILDKTIDRDIEAQKANIDKNKTLFSMNMERYKNAQLAEAATRLQINNTLQAQVQMSAAKAGSPLAQSNAQILLGQLKQQQVPLQIQIAKEHLQARIAGAGGGQGGIPVNQAPAHVLMDPKTVQVGDRVYGARDPKEASELRTMQANYQPIVNGLKRLDDLSISAKGKFTPESAEAQAIRNGLMFKINELYGMKRLSEPDMKALTAQLDDPTSWKQMFQKGVRNSTFKRILDDSMDSAYSAKLPGYQGMGSLSSRKQGWK